MPGPKGLFWQAIRFLGVPTSLHPQGRHHGPHPLDTESCQRLEVEGLLGPLVAGGFRSC